MSNFSLYDRLRTSGTILELPKDRPNPLYALPSTLNWMKALSLVTKELNLNYQTAQLFYSNLNIQVRACSDPELNTVFEQLLFSLNQISSLRAMAGVPNKADVASIGIVAWYYAIYASASAMIAAAEGSLQEGHTPTANQWDKVFASNGLVMSPFGDRFTNLLMETVKNELEPIRSRGTHSLVTVPIDAQQGWGCVAEYLSGNADWWRKYIEEKVRKKPEFKKLGVSNFRSKKAIALRDHAFERSSISFLHQAIRYRGKANYRDAIFLAYGKGVPSLASSLIDELSDVATAFSSMAAGYVTARIGKNHWSAFINDLEKKRSVTLSPKSIWS